MAFPIRIIAFGRKSDILSDEVRHYLRLLKPYASAEIAILKPPAGQKAARKEQQSREYELMRARWPKRSYLVALSEEGRLQDSRTYSKWIEKRMLSGVPLVFNIGSAHGLPVSVKDACDEIISLSPLTLSHGISLIVLLEQLYRAFTILKNHPYHKP